MSSTLRISRGFIAALITICVFFTCLPFSRTVRADSNRTIYYACCKFNEDTQQNEEIVSTNSIPEGYDCYAVMVDGGTGWYLPEQFILDSYADQDDENNIPIVANNALIDAGNLVNLNYALLGNSSIRFSDQIGIHSSKYEYTGDKTSFSAIEDYIRSLGNKIEESYSLLVNGNYSINEPAVFDEIYVASNVTLTINHTGSEGHTEVTANKLKINNGGSVVIAGGTEPNGLNIIKELDAPASSITGSEGSVLLIENGASVKGDLVLYATDGTTAETGNGFDNISYLETETYTYKTTGYDSPRWVKDGGDPGPGPNDPAGIYIAFSDDLFSSYTYQYAGGEVTEIPPEGNIAPVDSESITITLVPKYGTLSVKQGNLTPTVTNNSFTLYKSDYDWTKGPCYVEATAIRPNGIYFHCEDNLVDEINYDLGESGNFTVSGDYLPLSTYETASGINFHVVTFDESEPVSTYISTDGGLTLGTGHFDREFYIMKSGDSWADVYDVYIRRGEKKYPGMYLNFDRSENTPIEKIQYSLNDGELKDLTEEFLSYDIYQSKTKVKFVITPKEGVNNLDVRVDWDQNYIGSTVPLEGFSFENNEIVITKPANAEEWGAIYEIGINVPGEPVPGGTFEIRFPGAPQVVDGVQCRFNESEGWGTAAADGDDLYFNIDRNRTAVYLKLVPRENSAPLSIKVESKANPGDEPVEMTGISLDADNQFVLTKPEGEGADWEGNYIVTITAEGGDTPTPTPDPENELARYGGYQIRLDGYVGVALYVALDQGIKDSKTKVTFTYDSDFPELATQEIGFDQAHHVTQEDGGDFYVFDMKVVPNEMTKTITAVLTNENYSVTLRTFTARECVEEYTNSSKYSPETVNLAKAIKNYGYYAQLKFGPDTPIFAQDALTLTDPAYDKVTVGTIQDGITYGGTSVVFLSGNKIKHYFTITNNPDAYTFKIDGKDVAKVSEGNNEYYISSEEMYASKLNTGIVVEIYFNGTKIKEFSYSATNYAKGVVVSAKTSDEMKNLAKAFAMYYEAANAYNHPGNQ
ncbi:MAG: hypothetical protein IKZ42_07540 [Clostridiales bacterium]|nr:hypothetical protein [Clostridiales bacterium]